MQYRLDIFYDLNDLTDVPATDSDIENAIEQEIGFAEDELNYRNLQFFFQSEYEMNEAQQRALDAGYRTFR